MDNGHSIAYILVNHIGLLLTLQFIIHIHTHTHKPWALLIFAKEILQSSKIYTNLVKVT